jgi:hypothetical protein
MRPMLLGALSMATSQERFESWFVKVLETLYLNKDAGLAILMIVLPLLERYLRGKVGLAPNAPTNDKFNNELFRIFPELETEDKAKNFWQVYRHGLLHQVTFSDRNQKGKNLPVGWISHEGPIIFVNPDGADGSFWVNTVDFGKRVIKKIMGDFAAFEKTNLLQLPVVKPFTESDKWNTPSAPVVFGTSAERPQNGDGSPSKPSTGTLTISLE